MKKPVVMSFLVIFVTLAAGCSTAWPQKRRAASPPTPEGPAQVAKTLFREMGVAPNLYQREPSDSGAQSSQHIRQMQAIQLNLEADLARMEAEATRVEIAKKLGVDYKPVPFISTSQSQPGGVPKSAPPAPSGPPPGGKSPLLLNSIQPAVTSGAQPKTLLSQVYRPVQVVPVATPQPRPVIRSAPAPQRTNGNPFYAPILPNGAQVVLVGGR